MVRTAAGGGQAGPLRIDLAGRFAGDCMRAYSEAEARQAFQRMEAQHRVSGWDPAGGGGGSGAAPCCPLHVFMMTVTLAAASGILRDQDCPADSAINTCYG